QRVHDVVPVAGKPAERGQSERVSRSETADLQPARVTQADQPPIRALLDAGRSADDDVDLVALCGQVPREVVQIALAATTDVRPAERMNEGDAHGLTGRVRTGSLRTARRGTTQSF